MKTVTTSLMLIAMSGAVGLALSGGHAALRSDVDWLSLAGVGTTTVGAPTRVTDIWAPEQQKETVAMSSAQWPQDEATAPSANTPAPGFGAVVAVPTGSPRPVARPTVAPLNVADASGPSIEGPSDRMSINGGLEEGVATRLTLDDGFGVFDPSSVSLATVMSKGPVAMTPVPSYMHGVFR